MVLDSGFKEDDERELVRELDDDDSVGCDDDNDVEDG